MASDEKIKTFGSQNSFKYHHRPLGLFTNTSKQYPTLPLPVSLRRLLHPSTTRTHTLLPDWRQRPPLEQWEPPPLEQCEPPPPDKKQTPSPDQSETKRATYSVETPECIRRSIGTWNIRWWSCGWKRGKKGKKRKEDNAMMEYNMRACLAHRRQTLWNLAVKNAFEEPPSHQGDATEHKPQSMNSIKVRDDAADNGVKKDRGSRTAKILYGNLGAKMWKRFKKRAGFLRTNAASLGDGAAVASPGDVESVVTVPSTSTVTNTSRDYSLDASPGTSNFGRVPRERSSRGSSVYFREASWHHGSHTRRSTTGRTSSDGTSRRVESRRDQRLNQLDPRDSVYKAMDLLSQRLDLLKKLDQVDEVRFRMKGGASGFSNQRPSSVGNKNRPWIPTRGSSQRASATPDQPECFRVQTYVAHPLPSLPEQWGYDQVADHSPQSLSKHWNYDHVYGHSLQSHIPGRRNDCHTDSLGDGETLHTSNGKLLQSSSTQTSAPNIVHTDNNNMVDKAVQVSFKLLFVSQHACVDIPPRATRDSSTSTHARCRTCHTQTECPLDKNVQKYVHRDTTISNEMPSEEMMCSWLASSTSYPPPAGAESVRKLQQSVGTGDDSSCGEFPSTSDTEMPVSNTSVHTMSDCNQN